MALKFNGTNIETVKFNGTVLDKLIYNGVTVWEAWRTVTGASFLPISQTLGWDVTLVSSVSSFHFKNPTFSVSGTLSNGDSFDHEGSVKIEAYNVSSSSWVHLYTYKTGDVYSESTKDFSFTYTDTSNAMYSQWRTTKSNGSNWATINGKIISYTYKP